MMGCTYNGNNDKEREIVNVRLTFVVGALVRVGPNEIMCFEFDEVRRILSFKCGYTKDMWYKIGKIQPNEENTMTILDPAERKLRKKRVLPAVRFQSLPSPKVKILTTLFSTPVRVLPTLSPASTPASPSGSRPSSSDTQARAST